MGDTSPELPAECARVLGPVCVAELYLKGLSGAYRDRGAAFRALSYAERLIVWDGEHDAAGSSSMARAAAEEAALAGRRPSEEARRLNIAQFLADNPGVDISSLKPRAFPGYTYLPGQECEFCHGSRDGERCLGSPECLFRYRAGFFTRQGGICPCCGEPLPAHLGMAGDHRGAKRAVVAIDHIIPRSRGGPTHAEWNKQLLHLKCNSSKGNQVAAPALALAAEHGIKVLDYLAAWEHPGPMPRDAEVHLLPPLLEHDGIFRSPLDRVGHRLRALCGHDFGVGWFP